MTTTDVTVRAGGSTDLTIDPGQTFFTEKQVAALRQLGVDHATNADLAVFFHHSVRTGLDPFARQIYMIERLGKQTIQTGIDGFRLVARRATDRAGGTFGYEDTLWCGPDGQWRDVWLSADAPAAAKVTVVRDGQRYPAIALYSEYVALKRDGRPNSMWSSKPALMLAKCAEALALRRAFPQDLSGLHTADEMGRLERVDDSTVHDGTVSERSGVSRLRAAVPAAAPDEVDQEFQTPAEDVHDAEVVDPEPADAPLITPAQNRKLHAMLRQAGAGEKDAALPLISSLVGRKVESTKDLTRAEANTVIDTLEQDTAEPATEGDDMFPPVDGGAA